MTIDDNNVDEGGLIFEKGMYLPFFWLMIHQWKYWSISLWKRKIPTLIWRRDLFLDYREKNWKDVTGDNNEDNKNFYSLRWDVRTK